MISVRARHTAREPSWSAASETRGAVFGNRSRIGACDFFRPALILLVILAGLIGLFLIIRIFLRDYLAHRRAAACWRAEQEVAPPEVMEQARWRGDSSTSEDLSQAELAARIKERLVKQRQKTDGGGSSFT